MSISQFLEPVNVTVDSKRDFADMIKHLEVVKLTWVIRMNPKYKYPYKREAEGDLIHSRRCNNRSKRLE